MDREATQGLAADYKVTNSTARGLDADAAGKVARVPGVAAAAPVTSAGLDTRGRYRRDHRHGPEGVRQGRATRLPAPARCDDIGPGRIAVSDEFAEQAGLHVGGTIDAGWDHRPPARSEARKKLTVVGIYAKTRAADDALGTLADVLPYSTSPKKLENVLVKAEPGQAAGLERKIRAALGDSPLLKVRSQEQLVKDEQRGPSPRSST